MSIGSTRKISSDSSTASRVDRRSFEQNNHSQFVENIDTANNVLVRDDAEREHHSQQQQPQPKNPPTDFTSATPDISTSIEALALSGILEDDSAVNNNRKIDVYSNNQSIIKDEEIERTGRSYLKHFYEKNEHLIDVDELV